VELDHRVRALSDEPPRVLHLLPADPAEN
jgi:hypothetical protein